jgi:hypothetical protein
MGAKQDRSLDLPHPLPAVAAAVERALQALGAEILFRAPEQGSFSARTGATIWSLGEQLNIATEVVSPTASRLRISSETSQLYDWGKNAQNLQQFEQALMLALASGGSPISPTPTAPTPAAPGPTVSTPPPIAAGRRVFISYRRDDSSTIVGRICDRLVRDLGDENVFKDIDNIPFGVDFVEYLDREVQKCGVLFAVIGPHWLQPGSDGARRLDDPHDFVRIEIGSALRRGIPVVPLLVEGARMPREDELPDDLKPLARRNGTEIRRDPDFHVDMSRLLSRLG